MAYNDLTDEEERIICDRVTELPFSGQYVNHSDCGSYICKRCDFPLYISANKFDAHCGWAAFDAAVENNVRYIPDPDGIRTEIVCGNCGGHLGHVFEGEGYTPKNIRHCVNSASLNFMPSAEKRHYRAYFACGCFWGAEHYFMHAKGVASTAVGFMGGVVKNPSYEEVCTQQTGHFETTEVVYHPEETSFEALAKLFFEIHDFTQFNGQGSDIGLQYRSCIFYSTPAEKAIAERLIETLIAKDYNVATAVLPVETFWKAEEYHQQYYQKSSGRPYCHHYRKIFP